VRLNIIVLSLQIVDCNSILNFEVSSVLLMIVVLFSIPYIFSQLSQIIVLGLTNRRWNSILGFNKPVILCGISIAILKSSDIILGSLVQSFKSSYSFIHVWGHNFFSLSVNVLSTELMDLLTSDDLFKYLIMLVRQMDNTVDQLKLVSIDTVHGLTSQRQECAHFAW